MGLISIPTVHEIEQWRKTLVEPGPLGEKRERYVCAMRPLVG